MVTFWMYGRFVWVEVDEKGREGEGGRERIRRKERREESAKERPFM